MAGERPDRSWSSGDTNSGLSAIVAKRMGIPVYHMEAGNRCFDDRVPEEVNRRIDRSQQRRAPAVHRAEPRRTCCARGSAERITSRAIRSARCSTSTRPQIAASDVLARLGLTAGRYLLVTLHRAENVDVPERLRAVVEAFGRLHRER